MAIGAAGQPKVDALHLAQRSSNRPLDHGALGHYRIGTSVNCLPTQVGGSTLFSFRWGDATRFCVIQSFKLTLLQAVTTGAWTTTQTMALQALKVSAFTASDSGGIPGPFAVKRRASMPTSLVTDSRLSNAAAGITVGTRTVDSNGFQTLFGAGVAAAPTVVPYTMYGPIGDDHNDSNTHPFVLAQDEGFIVTWAATAIPAAGAAIMTLDMDWAEVTAYPG